MRRMLVLIVLSILVVALSGSVMADQNRGLQLIDSTWEPQHQIGLPDWGDDEGDDNNGLGFGKKIAGTYEGKFRLAPDGPVLTGYQTYNLDGTIVTTDAGIYAGTNPFIPLGIRQSFGAGHGAWEKIGPREAQVLGVLQGFHGECKEDGTEDCDSEDPNEFPGFTCCDPTLTGTLFIICAPSGPYQWAPDFQTATGSFHTVCYLPPEDPDAYFTEGAVIFDSEAAFGAAGVATLTRVNAFDVPPPMNP